MSGSATVTTVTFRVTRNTPIVSASNVISGGGGGYAAPVAEGRASMRNTYPRPPGPGGTCITGARHRIFRAVRSAHAFLLRALFRRLLRRAERRLGAAVRAVAEWLAAGRPAGRPAREPDGRRRLLQPDLRHDHALLRPPPHHARHGQLLPLLRRVPVRSGLRARRLQPARRVAAAQVRIDPAADRRGRDRGPERPPYHPARGARVRRPLQR